MRSSGQRPYDPMRDLMQSIRVAAVQIEEAHARRIAARDADRIPLTRTERAHGRKAEIAQVARAIMRRLPDMPRSEYADAASTLRACAEALDSHFREEITPRRGMRRMHAAL